MYLFLFTILINNKKIWTKYEVTQICLMRIVKKILNYQSNIPSDCLSVEIMLFKVICCLPKVQNVATRDLKVITALF